jgi:hypothetical protein
MTIPLGLKKTFHLKSKDSFVILLLLFVTCVFYWPVFQNMGRLFSCVDWYEKYCFLFSSRNTILGYHQFPFRNPMIAGGYPTIGHPYDDSLNPLFLFTLIFGEATGIRLMIFSIFILGALGMFYLTRYVLNYNLSGAFFSAATFALCSYGACQFTEGNLEKIYLYLIPWVLAFFIKSKHNPRFIVACVLVLSMFLIKGIISVSVLVFLFLVTCLYSIEIKERKLRVNFSYILIFIAVVCLAVSLCAPKILSTLQLIAQKKQFLHWPFENSYTAISHYTVAQGRLLSLNRLYESLFVKDAYLNRAGDFSQMYLGYIPIALFFLSVLAYWRKAIRFLVILAFFIIIASGSNSPVDLFKLLWHIHPFIHTIWKLDDAFFLYIFLTICIVSGGAFLLLDRVEKHRRIYIYAVSVLIFFSISHMFFANQRYLLHPDIKLTEPQFSQEIPLSTPVKSFFQVRENFLDKTKEDYFYLKAGVGIVNFQQDLIIKIKNHAIPKYFVDRDDYRYIFAPEGRLKPNPKYKGEAFFLNEENQAQMLYFSPNEMRIRVIIKEPDRLVINQNYHKSWKINYGYIDHYQGLLSVNFRQKGVYEVVLSYIPLDFYLGLIFSLFAIASFFVICKFPEKIKFQIEKLSSRVRRL